MEKVLDLKRSKREELIHNKLCNNLAQHLDIKISEVFSPDFFISKCELANMYWYCPIENKTNIPTFIPARKAFVKCLITEEEAPAYSRICHCENEGLADNYIIKHVESDQFFILGSKCVSRLNPLALKRICQTCGIKHRDLLSFTHCASCRKPCSICGINIFHSFNADCSDINSEAYKFWFASLDDFEQMAVISKRPCLICKSQHQGYYCLDKMVTFGKHKFDHYSFLDLYQKKRSYFFWLSENGYPWLIPALEDYQQSRAS